jgi:hypothetical protein
MSTLRTRLSTDAWAILLAAALGLIIRFGLLRSVAW